MPILVWDKVGNRVYETGLDRGVLYLADGSAVPWNGLTSIIEKFDKKITPVYYEGMKINDSVSLGDFSATMKAVTYPDEFIEIEGITKLKNGIFVNDQPPQLFGLCYRTRVGNDIEGDIVGYKIHILYNVTAIPSDKTYASVTPNPSLVEFEWTISAIPEELPGLRPTAHLIINSLDLDPFLLIDIENILYGGSDASAALIPMSDLVTYIKEWYRVKITDHGDGTWTAFSNFDIFIEYLTDDLFQISKINATYLDDTTFEISDTVNINDVPQISVIYNLDETFTVTTSYDDLIIPVDSGTIEILNANISYIDLESFKFSDTAEE